MACWMSLKIGRGWEGQRMQLEWWCGSNFAVIKDPSDKDFGINFNGMPWEALKLVCWVGIISECLSSFLSVRSTADVLLPETC